MREEEKEVEEEEEKQQQHAHQLQPQPQQQQPQEYHQQQQNQQQPLVTDPWSASEGGPLVPDWIPAMDEGTPWALPSDIRMHLAALQQQHQRAPRLERQDQGNPVVIGQQQQQQQHHHHHHHHHHHYALALHKLGSAVLHVEDTTASPLPQHQLRCVRPPLSVVAAQTVYGSKGASRDEGLSRKGAGLKGWTSGVGSVPGHGEQKERGEQQEGGSGARGAVAKETERYVRALYKCLALHCLWCSWVQHFQLFGCLAGSLYVLF